MVIATASDKRMKIERIVLLTIVIFVAIIVIALFFRQRGGKEINFSAYPTIEDSPDFIVITEVKRFSREELKLPQVDPVKQPEVKNLLLKYYREPEREDLKKQVLAYGTALLPSLVDLLEKGNVYKQRFAITVLTALEQENVEEILLLACDIGDPGVILLSAQYLIKPELQKRQIREKQRLTRAYGKRKSRKMLKTQAVNLDKRTKAKLTTALQEVLGKGDENQKKQAEYLSQFIRKRRR